MAAPPYTPGSAPFDMSLKMAMGSQNAALTSPSGGPVDLQTLLSRINANGSQIGYGGTSSFTGGKLAEFAKQWEGKEFKPGQTARCADFVSTMIQESGAAPQGFKPEVNCWELQKQGRSVDKHDLKPGDLVYFGYTYLPVDYTHVGIYLGDGKFVHRPTVNQPVRIDSIEGGYYGEKFSGARRLTA